MDKKTRIHLFVEVVQAGKNKRLKVSVLDGWEEYKKLAKFLWEWVPLSSLWVHEDKYNVSFTKDRGILFTYDYDIEISIWPLVLPWRLNEVSVEIPLDFPLSDYITDLLLDAYYEVLLEAKNQYLEYKKEYEKEVVSHEA